MEVEAVASAMGGGDLGDGAVDRAWLGPPGTKRDDGAFGRTGSVASPRLDIGIARPAVQPIDNQVVFVLDLVRDPRRSRRPTIGRAAGSDGSHTARSAAARSSLLLARDGAMQRRQDIAALSHPPQHRLQLRGEPPEAWGPSSARPGRASVCS